MNETQKKGKFVHWFKTSITARMMIVGFLCLLLLIPMEFVKDLIRERSYTQGEVIREINQKWGGEVSLYGPILQIPYRTYSEKIITDSETKKIQKETIEHINYAYFLPNELHVEGTINPEEKKRGIYKTAVYTSNLHLTGSYDPVSFAEFEVEEKDILWNKAKIIVKTSNVKGINESVKIELNKQEYIFNTKLRQQNTQYLQSTNYNTSVHNLETGYISLEDSPKTDSKKFNINYSVNGSEQIRIVPIGKETTVNLKSDWKTASFFGEFLPYNSDKITENGFDAKWKVLDINRPFSQQFNQHIPDLSAYTLGVNFMIPVDEYLKSTRSAKYGLLVISLTFLVFFMIQTLSNIPIHTFQYLMIGLALVMFYTLLISISEHSNYLKAYIIATMAVVGLITLYSKTILKGNKFPIFIGASLTALYSFIFIIIQMENYALITGSIGLFVILAIVMFASRKINWNNE